MVQIKSGQSRSQVRVSGKNMDLGDALRQQAAERVGDVVAKYFSGGFAGHVTVEKEGTAFRTECVLHLDTGATMTVSGSDHDAYASLTAAVERIAKQLRRDKRRREPRSTENGILPDVGAPSPDRDEDLDDSGADDQGTADARAIVAERLDRLDRLSLEGAIARMEKDANDVLVFRNGGTGRVNVIHTRPDGSIGWLDLTEIQPRSGG
jgi:ribosomal subunit interface protein